MKTLLMVFVSVFFFLCEAHASNVLVFNTTTNNAIDYRKFVHTPDFIGRADVLINPDVAGLISGKVPVKHWKVSGSVVSEMNQSDKDAVDATNDANKLASKRNQALAVIAADSGEGRKWRALFLLLLDEINRSRIADGVATITVQQVKTAFQNKITSGDAD